MLAAPRPAKPVVALVPRGSITTGDHHVCAVDAAGKVVCWGKGGTGRLGTPGDDDQLTPTVVPGLADIAGVAAGMDITCAWTVHGAVWCWGDDENTNRAGDHRPRRVPGLDDIVQVVAGAEGACGLRHDGHIACWTADHWRDPLWPPAIELGGIADAVEIAGDARHLCARTARSDVVCSLAKNGKFELRDQAMTPLPELRGAMSLAGENEVFAALYPDHRVATWDIADLEGRRMPAPDRPIQWITGVDGERVIVGGDRFGVRQVCALGARATCWSAGNPDVDPAQVLAKAHVIDKPLQDLALGGEVSCARIADHLECWGLIGRLGDGSSEIPAEPVEVKGLTDARQLEIGMDTACVLRATGRVACWGARDIAHLADGKPMIDFEPVELPGVDDAIEIAMSYDTTCARRRGGGTTCWNTTDSGQRRPVDRPELAGATRLLSAGSEVCGVDDRGHVACRPAAIPVMQNSAAVVHELEANLAVGRPCAASTRDDTECWHGPMAIQISFTQNYAVECVVKAGKIACHYGKDTKRTFDPILDVDHIVSYDGTYGLTADGHVVMAGEPFPGRPPIDKFTDIVELRAGGRQLCGRRGDGKVLCWGPRDYLGAGQRGMPGDPTPVPGLVLGAPRPYEPIASVPRPTAAPLVGSVATRLGTSMQGPFPYRDDACNVVTCSAKQRRDCGLDDPLSPRAMEAPPAPFTEARLMAINCRDPEYRRDGSLTYRMLVKRDDGYWISGPLFGVGGNDHYCSAAAETRWEARDVVAGGHPDIVLSVLARTSCHGVNGGGDDDLDLLVIAADAKKPQAFAPIPIAEGYAASCGEGRTDCPAGQDATRLDATFSADGLLAIGGAAMWGAIRRSKVGAIEGVEPTKHEKTPVGRYRFVTR